MLANATHNTHRTSPSASQSPEAKHLNVRAVSQFCLISLLLIAESINAHSIPQFTNCPSESISLSHCETARFDFDAVDPDGDSIRYLISSVKGAGTAVLDPITGQLEYFPGVPLDINKDVIVTVKAFDIVNFDSAFCSVDFSVINHAPNVSCGLNSQYLLAGTALIKTDIIASDSDKCDALMFLKTKGPGSVDPGTGVFSWTPSPSDAGIFHVTISVLDGYVSREDSFDIAVYNDPFEIKIERISNAPQGRPIDLQINQIGGHEYCGGYDLTLAYNASHMTLINVLPGDLFSQCGWEYFSYRLLPASACGPECPSGLVNILAQGDIYNGTHFPNCYIVPLPATLATVTFRISGDTFLRCSYLPVSFFWQNCVDNRFSSESGDSIYVVKHVYDYIDIGGFDQWSDITDTLSALPGRLGIPANPCLSGSEDGQALRLRYIDYRNGGFDIVCAESINYRGDLNANGIPNEIADAVTYIDYFLTGPVVFGSHINNDGMQLSIADLVFLIRVITGDATPFEKPTSSGGVQLAQYSSDRRTIITCNSGATLGAVLLTFKGEVDAGCLQLGSAASGMDFKFATNGDESKLLIYSFSRKKIRSGSDTLCIISSRCPVDLIEADIADANGFVMRSEISGPKKLLVLDQNYPNPFNAGTLIRFSLPAYAHAQLSIFNLLGQNVRSLIAEGSQAGVGQCHWDGRNEAGLVVPSGIYIYQLTVDGQKISKKMLLMK
jgi:hypothetical protein